MRALIFTAVFSIVFFAVDYYVFRNWKPFARRSPRLRWTVPAYRVLLGVMLLVLPVYFFFSEWWEVEPKLLRRLLIGAWAIWYIPKFVVALVLMLKDAARFVTWLFGWFQQRLASPPPSGPAPSARENLPDLTDMKRMSRKEFLHKAGWAMAAVPFVSVGYSVFRGLYDFTVHRVTIPIPGLPPQFEGLQIAQLSDLHAGSLFSPRPMHEAVELVNSLRPDLVAITGDYVNNDHREAPVILPALAELQAPLGVYGCLGNHDHYADTQRVVEQIRAAGVNLLVNQHHTVSVDGAALHVIGTDNTGFRQQYADLDAAQRGIAPHPHGESTKLLLAHDPTFWDGYILQKQADIPLMLCGHTHGGQIGVEVGPLRWGLSRFVYDRWAGLYTETPEGQPAQHLYVNRGLGTVGPPVRIGIKPEITLITLVRA